MRAQHLIFDGDDTLWENNVVFEHIKSEFARLLEHPALSADQIRKTLEDINVIAVSEHGYGSRVFARSLEETFRQLPGRELARSERAAIRSLLRRLTWDEVELIPGVADTLERLACRHDVLLLTKGSREEQQLKIDASGLGRLFRRIVIVPEKDPAVYRTLIDEERLGVTRTWMIGNSARSDILPALEVGIGAVYIPHPHTWYLEATELPDDHPGLLRIRSFSELLDHL
jgi:putative hydrolase of the HAD superfamily